MNFLQRFATAFTVALTTASMGSGSAQALPPLDDALLEEARPYTSDLHPMLQKTPQPLPPQEEAPLQKRNTLEKELLEVQVVQGWASRQFEGSYTYGNQLQKAITRLQGRLKTDPLSPQERGGVEEKLARLLEEQQHSYEEGTFWAQVVTRADLKMERLQRRLQGLPPA